MPEALGPGAPGKFALAAWGGDAAPASAPASRGEQTGEEDAPSPTARLPGPARGVSPGALDRGRGVRSCRRRREGKRPRRGPLASPRGCLAPGGRWRQAGRRGRPGAQTFPRRLRRRNHPREGRGVQSSAAPPDGAPGRRTHGPAGRNWGTRLPPRSSEPRAENAPPGAPPAAGLRGAAGWALPAGWARAQARDWGRGRERVALAARGRETRSRRCTARSGPRRKAPRGRTLRSDPGRQQGRSAGARSEPGRVGKRLALGAPLRTGRAADSTRPRAPGRGGCSSAVPPPRPRAPAAVPGPWEPGCL